MHRAAAVACLAAGTGVLVGPGWALLVLGALLWLLAPRSQAAREEQAARLQAWTRRGRVVADRVVDTFARAAQAPRRTTAVASMTAGVVGVPVGLLLMVGVGAAVVAAGGMCVGLSLLTGWEPSAPAGNG